MKANLAAARVVLLAAVFFVLGEAPGAPSAARAQARGSLPSTPDAQEAAPKPAVKALNARVSGVYTLDRAERATESVVDPMDPMSAILITFPQSETNTWRGSGVLTAPIAHRVGGRLLVAGGESTLRIDSGGSFAGLEEDETFLATSATLFWRDPELGHIDLGYRFAWEDFGANDDRATGHGIFVAAGLYVPDLGAGPVDYDAAFFYERGNVDVSGPELRLDFYGVGATAAWYLADSARIAGGFRWNRTEFDLGLTTTDLRGTASLDWLIPFEAERRFATVSVFGSAGRFERDQLPAPFTSIERGVFDVGVALTLSYPGGRSLVELAREYY